MTESIAPNVALDHVIDMEDEICDLRRVARLLLILSASKERIEADSLHPLAIMLSHMGDRLHGSFVGCHRALGGQP